MIYTIILLGIILVMTLIYLCGKYNENYWEKRGVTFHKKNKIAGVVWDYIFQDRALFEIFGDLYNQYPNEPAIGVASFNSPALFVRDYKNIQHVLQSDFQSFNHRGFDVNKEDILANNILFMNGPKWKVMRQHMTPLFTAAKLKNMYYIVDKCANDFVEFLKKNPEKLKGNAFDTLTTFCSAAIAASVFGIGTKSTFESPLLAMARKSVEPHWRNNLKFAIGSISPALFKLLGIKLFGEFEDLFIGAIKKVIRKREEENVKKHDFADICVTLQKNDKLKDPSSGVQMEPTDELLAAQAFFFFIAGVEPSATVIFCTLVELGKNPEILQRLHNEIDESFEKNNGQMTYDTVSDMEYLEKVLSEAMRMYPPIGYLTRECVKDTILPVGNIKVDKGTKIFTPVFELHHDPKLYPDPKVFNPDRFSDKNNYEIAYMPFGMGNRTCIGSRYATFQVKAGLVHVLRNFTVKTTTSKSGMKYSKAQVQVRPINVDVEFIPRSI